MQKQDYKERIKSFADIVEYLISIGSVLTPCTVEEVVAVESFYKVSLPGVYKEFLLSMGKDATSYMEGTNVYYNCVFEQRKIAEVIIEESQLTKLALEDFVFWSHQGYIFAYFKVDAGDNPPVFIVYDWGKVVFFENLFEFFKAELHLDGFIKVEDGFE